MPAIGDKYLTGLVHVVHFWLKADVSDEDRVQFVEGVKALGQIEHVNILHVGVAANTEQRDVVDNSFSVSEILFFDDEVAQKAYQDHPLHHQFVDTYSHLWEKIVVQDSVKA